MVRSAISDFDDNTAFPQLQNVHIVRAAEIKPIRDLLFELAFKGQSLARGRHGVVEILVYLDLEHFNLLRAHAASKAFAARAFTVLPLTCPVSRTQLSRSFASANFLPRSSRGGNICGNRRRRRWCQRCITTITTRRAWHEARIIFNDNSGTWSKIP
jgi:hypothetical protein